MILKSIKPVKNYHCYRQSIKEKKSLIIHQTKYWNFFIDSNMPLGNTGKKWMKNLQRNHNCSLLARVCSRQLQDTSIWTKVKVKALITMKQDIKYSVNVFIIPTELTKFVLPPSSKAGAY